MKDSNIPMESTFHVLSLQGGGYVIEYPSGPFGHTAVAVEDLKGVREHFDKWILSVREELQDVTVTAGEITRE